jgi:hypothetical protein
MQALWDKISSNSKGFHFLKAICNLSKSACGVIERIPPERDLLLKFDRLSRI